jgi:branched-chain amino acid aminotransferase
LTRYDLYNADECFITGTAAEIAPVASIDGRVIGRGRPGSVTRKFMAAYHALTNSEGEAI